MRVREHNRVQAADIDGRWRPVAQSEFLEALKQIDGFPLELELAGFTSTVTKIEAKSTPASAFEIPAGYALEKKKLFDEEKKEEREE